jgi:hypothetical protein
MNWIENKNFVKRFYDLPVGQAFIDLHTGETHIKINDTQSYNCSGARSITSFVGSSFCLLVSGLLTPDEDL